LTLTGNISNRKKDHIELAFKSRTELIEQDDRFFYEPLLSKHPDDDLEEIDFLGKVMKAPIWVSSMTGGTGEARHINQNLARACGEFGLGMGLGSCRPLLDSDEYFEDFNLRPLIGTEYPFYANLGIAQVEQLIEKNETDRIVSLVERLAADGLIIHINPLQEWLQPEGDSIKQPPIQVIAELLERTGLNIIVKEVGQGMGPESLEALLKSPIGAIEFGAFGGTNFAKLEIARTKESKRSYYEPISKIGHNVYEMLEMVNSIAATEKIKCENLIVSGGLTSFLDGYYLISKSKLNAVYGQASSFLKHARVSYESLKDFVEHQIDGLKISEAYFRIK